MSIFQQTREVRRITTPRWRYLVTDLLTDQRVAELALTQVKFDRRVSRAGSFSGTLSIANLYQAQVASQLASSVGRLAIYAIRNSMIWWGGVLWTSTPSGVGARGAETLALQGATFESYAARRYIRTDLTYSQVDQGVIMPSLWRTLQSTPSGDIGVQAPDQPTGILRDRTYKTGDVSAYEDKIEELGDVIDGSEHTIDVFFDNDGSRVKRFRVGKLQLGQGGDLPPPMVVSGHSVPSYSRVNDATTGGTTFQTRGAVAGGNAAAAEDPLMSDIFPAQDLLDSGWPELDVTNDYTTTTDVKVLNSHAAADRLRFAGQSVIPSYSIYVPDDSDWSPNRIGETMIIHHVDQDLWNPGKRVAIRPVVIEVTPGDSGEHETIDITVSDPRQDTGTEDPTETKT